MPASQQIIYKELSREESRKYLDSFEIQEYRSNPPSTDWYDSDSASLYVWIIDVTNEEEIPIGFIGYNLFSTMNDEEFIYIMKFFVLKKYRKYNNENLIESIEGEKVSSLLFKNIMSKNKNIITLTPANERLSKYYEREYGFIYNKEISEKFADIVGVSICELMYLNLEVETRRDKIEF
ncbi:MAG: hypothetical protein P8Y46_07200 [Sulfurovaceae bacterium]